MKGHFSLLLLLPVGEGKSNELSIHSCGKKRTPLRHEKKINVEMKRNRDIMNGTRY